MTFSNDFIGPAAFYNVLSNRSPFLSNKCLRKYKTHCNSKSLFLNFFNAPKSGRLLVANVTANVFGTHLDNIIIHHTDEKFLKYGERAQLLLPNVRASYHKNDAQAKTTHQVKSVTSHLIVIIFVLDCDDESVMKDPYILITNTLKSLNKMGSDSSLYFNVFEVSCQHLNTQQPFFPPHNEKLESCRSLFSPMFVNRQSIILMRKLRSTFLTISNLSSKFEIGMEVEFSWVSTTKINRDNNKNHLSKIFPQLFYHYAFTKDSQDLINNESLDTFVEQMDVMQCPWCGATFGNSKFSKDPRRDHLDYEDAHGRISLLHHLDSNHLHFSYNAVVDEMRNLHIIVSRDRNHDADDQTILEEKIRPFFYQNQNKLLSEEVDISQVEIPHISFNIKNQNGKLIAKTRSVVEDTTQQMMTKTTNYHTRQYYHARLGLPLTDYEFTFYDSDDDIDMSFEKASNSRGLEEFEDISGEEKELMKMWNTHVNSFPPYSNAYVGMACELFVRKFGSIILAKGLRHNLLLHLMNLVDFNLLRLTDVKSCIQFVDSLQQSILINKKNLQGEDIMSVKKKRKRVI